MQLNQTCTMVVASFIPITVGELLRLGSPRSLISGEKYWLCVDRREVIEHSCLVSLGFHVASLRDCVNLEMVTDSLYYSTCLCVRSHGF